MLTLTNDFQRDVLEILKSRKVTFHGCQPDSVELNGASVKIWFYGYRKKFGNAPWAGGITITAKDAENAMATGNSNVLAEICEKIIDHGQMRFQ